MTLSQTIVPIYLPMPTGDMPAEDVNTLALVAVGLICLVVGFCLGMLLHDKIFKI